MHAGIPTFRPEVRDVFSLGALEAAKVPDFAEKLGGRITSAILAEVIEKGFGFVLRDTFIEEGHGAKARAFFARNFVITDPNAPGGRRFYQGRFLIRTRKPGDELNVWFGFCQDPDAIYRADGDGDALNSLAIVSAKALSEEEADEIQRDPAQVDLVIRFRDLESIAGLVGREKVDVVGLLLENAVQLTGHAGHLFKLGAIAKSVELFLAEE